METRPPILLTLEIIPMLMNHPNLHRYWSKPIRCFITSLQLQEIEGEDVYKDVLLLLALYREVTLVNASSQRQNVCDEVCSKLKKVLYLVAM